MRFETSSLAEKLAMFNACWAVVEQYGIGRFVIITNKRIRVRSLPEAL